MAELTIDRAMQLALAHRDAGRLTEAEILCRHVLAAQPGHADALNLLGVLAYQAGHADAAVSLIERAAAINPDSAEYRSNLGNLRRATGDVAGAIAAYRAALQNKPDLAQIHTNLGCALAANGQADAAIASHRAALRLDPSLAEAHGNLANALVDCGFVGEAEAEYRAALALAPDRAAVRCNLAMCLLLQGDFAAGWPGYESRRLGDGSDRGRSFAQPEWRGEPLDGRTILLHAEQGLGDTIQFVRYARLAYERGGRVIVECQPELVPLLEQLPYVARFTTPDRPPPPFDCHCPLLSLPLACGTTLRDVPAQDPPLRAPADVAERWRRRLATDRSPRVGVVWAGSAANPNDHHRSIAFARLTPLWAVPGVHYVGLQKGPTSAPPPAPARWTDAAADLVDFADTAGAIENLDLVISVDTAVAHLAGAMGGRVWLLLPIGPDWRWMRGRADSPWYPSMRVFRQRRYGDWNDVIDRVAAELATAFGTADAR